MAEAANPLLRLGRARKGRWIRQTAGNPTRRHDPQLAPLTITGSADEARQRFHWTREHRESSAGGVREDGTGCEEDDRSSDPRFRSAPTDRKHRSAARDTYMEHTTNPLNIKVYL